MDYNEWLSQLKAGDKVIISRAHWGSKISVVEKITPSGMIKVDGRMFNKNGLERGNNGYSGFPQGALEEITEESMKNVQKKVGIKW